jgi:hypothetical protein
MKEILDKGHKHILVTELTFMAFRAIELSFHLRFNKSQFDAASVVVLILNI